MQVLLFELFPLSDRPADKIEMVKKYLKANRMFRDYTDAAQDPVFSEVITSPCNRKHIFFISMIHIKEPLLLIGKSSPCGGSGFPFSLSEWSDTICLIPYNRR